MDSSWIFLELAVMLFFSIIGYLLSRKFKQPVSLGIIIFGIFLGPSVLGIVKYNDTVAIIAQLGSIVLLFIAGLNSNLKEVYTKRNFYMALWGSLVPIVGGFLISILFGYDIYTSIFVGATLTATCLGITSAVLKELGKIKTDTAKAMIGAAVIDDIISLSILSIVISVPSNVSIWSIALKLLLIIGFILVVLFFGEKTLTLILNTFSDTVARHSPKLTFVLGMCIVFFFSYISHLLGLAPIVGAFLIGVCISKSKATNILFAGGEYFEIIFTSIFFISIGIVVELSAFYTLFWFILALTLVAILTKVLGAGFSAYKMGFNKKDALIVGVGMAPRGEVAFIIALNGLLLGVITKEIYSAIVFMSFLTTVITLVLLKTLYNQKGITNVDVSEEVDFIDLKIKR
ncbi:MAG: cation:proton antiporter [Candidatus Woesearchaeota archaeon]